MNVDKKMLNEIKDLQFIAYEKDLVLLMGEKSYRSFGQSYGNGEIGFAVLKEVGERWFAVMPDGQLEYQCWLDTLFGDLEVRYYYSFEEAKKVIADYSFEEHSADNPKFYGHIRIYENEEFKVEYAYQKRCWMIGH